MKSIRSIAYYIFTALILVSLFSCKDKENEEPKPLKHWEKVVICYMVAENTLSEAIKTDINEMIEGASQLGDDECIVVYYDGAHKNDNPNIYLIDKNTTTLIPSYSFEHDQNSCSKTVMKQVFNYICSNYPAQSYGLVLSSHGTGWLPTKNDMKGSYSRRRAFGVDNGENSFSDNGDEMRITDLAESIKELPHLDFIFFDVCYMQSVEVAYELRNCADYIIASPAEIPNYGAPFDKVLSYLFTDEVDYKSFIDAYAVQCKGWKDYVLPKASETGIALSTVRCSKLQSLNEVTRKMMVKYADNINECKNNGTTNYLNCKYGSYLIGFYDMRDMMFQMMNEDDFSEWVSAYNEAVPYYYVASGIFSENDSREIIATSPSCGGMSMSLYPSDSYEKSVISEYEGLEWRYRENLEINNSKLGMRN